MKTLIALTIAGTLGFSAAAPLPLIPQPVAVQPGQGAFTFSAATGIRHHVQLAAEAGLLAADLAKLTGHPPQVVTKDQKILLASEILVREPGSVEPGSVCKS